MQKYWPGIVFLVLFFVVAVFGVVLFGQVFPSKSVMQLPPNRIVQCTMEAKVCPDGTSVGRSGPSCEFAPCPTTPTPAQNPLPDADDELQTTYIHGQEWPPKTEVTDVKFSCKEKLVQISNQDYCKQIETEGAAGSIYETYTYTTTFENNKTLKASFTLRKSQCGNFDEPQKKECEKERAAFDIDSLVHKYLQTQSSAIDGQL